MGVTTGKNYEKSLPKKGWEAHPSPTPHNIYQNTQLPDKWIQEYDICTDDEEMLNQLCDIYQWRKHSQYVISSEWMQLQGQKEICSTLHKGQLYLEHIPITLCDVTDIPYPDVLHLYHQVLQACLLLSRKLGCFTITQDCVGINMQGVVKVWFHHNHDRTYPHTTITQQSSLLHNIIQVLHPNTDYKTLPPSLPPLNEYILQHRKSTSLADAIRAVQEYASTYQMQIPDHLGCVDAVGGAGSIRQYWQQVHYLPISPGQQIAQPPTQTTRIQTQTVKVQTPQTPHLQSIQPIQSAQPIQQQQRQPTIITVAQQNINLRTVQPNTMIHIKPTHPYTRPSEQFQPRKTEPISQPSTHEPLQSRTLLPSPKQTTLPLHSINYAPLHSIPSTIPHPSNSENVRMEPPTVGSHESPRQALPRPSEEGGSSSMSSLGVSNVPNRTTKEYSDKMFSEIKEESIHNSTRNFYNQYLGDQSNYEQQAQGRQEGFSFGHEGTVQELLAKLKKPPISSPSNQYGNYQYNPNEYATSPVLQKQTYYQAQQPNTPFMMQHNTNYEQQQKYSPKQQQQYFSSYKYQPFEYQLTQQPYQYKPSSQTYQYKQKYTSQSYPYQYTTQKYTTQPYTGGGKYETNDGYDVEWDPEILADIKANVHNQ